MKWGFGWELGPFETWDAIGLEKSVSKMEEEGLAVPHLVKEMLKKGFTSFYKEESGKLFFYHNGEYIPAEENPKIINLNRLKRTKTKSSKKIAGASLIDLGDGCRNT